MSINFRELHAKHIALFNKKRGTRRASFGSDSALNLLMEEAESLLQELRSAGRVIYDQYQRQRLGSYAAYWGDFIFEESGTYPNTDLEPVEEKVVENLHGYRSIISKIDQLDDQHFLLLKRMLEGEPPAVEEGQSLEQKTQTPLSVPFLAPQLPSYAPQGYSSSIMPCGYKLVGRDDLLKQLKGQLLAGKSTIALHGLPGVGKTALAVALAHDPQVQAYFSDGVLWAGLGHEPYLMALLEQWGLTLGLTSEQIAKCKTIKEQGSLLRVAIGSKKMLLVVDDAWQASAALAFGVGGINCAFLITTRQPLIGLALAGESCPVRELSNEEGLALLKQLAPKAVAAEPEAAKELVAAVSGLPLALVLMGSELRKASYSTQPRRLRAAYARLATPCQRLAVSAPQVPAGHYPNLSANTPLSLPAVIAKHTLDSAAQRTLSALSLFPAKPNTFSELAALAVAGEPVETLDTLVDAGLLETYGFGRYTLHPTIADVARENGPDPEAKKRMIDFFLALTEEKEGQALEEEANNIQAALEMVQEGAFDAPCLRGASGAPI